MAKRQSNLAKSITDLVNSADSLVNDLIQDAQKIKAALKKLQENMPQKETPPDDQKK